MRVALISDIHGNLVALEAVLADIERQRVDKIVCLGDVCAIEGSQPREVLARVRTLDCACIMGNHDFHVINADLVHQDPNESSWYVERIDWCVAQLAEADLNYMRSFQPLVEVSLGGEATLLCFHASPRSNEEALLATTPAAELDEMLVGYTATVMAGGHTHVQMLRQHKGTLIVNAGSVGLPFEQNPFEDEPRCLPWAEYAIVSWENGMLGVDLRRVPIDLAAAKQAALASGMPGASEWGRYWLT